ncbi:MAG: hypothetical protein A2043_09245 [Candidatus Schekmanbacteria bacterium GWA2_38_9]|nr:MAG: hypothetical protein A2043_09245 [Candidatus Schekmanbacteria bacterium GWA2_38_9]
MEEKAQRKKAKEVFSDYAEAHFNLGVVYKNMGLLNEAEKEYQTALKINPGFALARQAIESISK